MNLVNQVGKRFNLDSVNAPTWISIKIMTRIRFLLPLKHFGLGGQVARRRRNRRRAIASVLGVGLVWATSAVAQEASFGTLSVASMGRQTIEGQAGGTTSLPSAVAGQAQDRLNNACLGYGALTPNHILELTSGRDRLVLTVDSGGQDTTLIVKGPDGQVLCGDDISGRNLDAQIAANGWQPGTYEVWVGTFESGQRYNYTLIVD